jgi:hypothetical protein
MPWPSRPSSARLPGVIGRALESQQPKLRQHVGRDAATLSFIRTWLPDFVFAMGLKRKF